MRAEKTRCNQQWTEARFMGFIKSALRAASNRWAPKYLCVKNARVARNQYKCALCPSIVTGKEIKADHIDPVVDVQKGFEGWDTFIKRLFCEVGGFQALCPICHARKTAGEQITRREVKASNNMLKARFAPSNA